MNKRGKREEKKRGKKGKEERGRPPSPCRGGHPGNPWFYREEENDASHLDSQFRQTLTRRKKGRGEKKGKGGKGRRGKRAASVNSDVRRHQPNHQVISRMFHQTGWGGEKGGEKKERKRGGGGERAVVRGVSIRFGLFPFYAEKPSFHWSGR